VAPSPPGRQAFPTAGDPAGESSPTAGNSTGESSPTAGNSTGRPSPTVVSIEPPSEDDVRAALRQVIDPELGDNIVDLGMVPSVDIGPGGEVRATVALTIAGCPLRGRIEGDVRARLGALAGVSSVEVVVGQLDASGREAVMSRARRHARKDLGASTIGVSTGILAISSGKGGVGKSSVTVNLAVALALRGETVGVLDADISGFSVPRLIGIEGQVTADKGKMIPLERATGNGLLRVLSMGFLAEEDRAIMWRGLVLNRAVQQFVEDVRWGQLDHLLIDLPPGTGDVQMGLARILPRTEVLVVTTPPFAAQKVAARAADMARRSHLRVAGVIENMSDFTCEHGSRYALFGSGGGDRLATDIGAPLIGRIPLHPDMGAGGDAGEPVAEGAGPLAPVFADLARTVAEEVSPLGGAGDACTARLLDRVEAAVRAGSV